MKSPKREFKEVQIRVPWGHIAGKWWGTQNVRPILALHGWQDNAGTFDTLIPLLPDHVGVLAIDFPGHGLSSRLPHGISYKYIDYIPVLTMIMREYNWDKLSIIGHSMGAIIGFLYGSIFPQKVDMIVAIDAIKPHIFPDHLYEKILRISLENFIVSDERNRDKSEPPSYSYEDCIQKLYLGTNKSVDVDKCKYLLERNIQKSTKYPEKYFFTRDSRVKVIQLMLVSHEVVLELANRISKPLLYVKASGSQTVDPEKWEETMEVLRTKPDFEFYPVDGTHHVHLNEPEKISEVINSFINKYRIEHLTSKL